MKPLIPIILCLLSYGALAQQPIQITSPKHIDSNSVSSMVDAYATDSHVYFLGTYSGNLSFLSDSASLPTIDQRDIVVVKMDHDLNTVWQNSFGTLADDGPGNIIVDIESSVLFSSYTIGDTQSTVSLVKLDSYGNLLWQFQGHSNKQAVVFGIVSDNLGGAYMVGNFIRSLEIPTSSDTVTLTNDIPNSEAGFILHIDGKGKLVSHTILKTAELCLPYRIAVKPNGNIVCIGTFKGSVIIDNNIISTEALRDVFISEFSETGSLIRLKKVGTNDGQAYGLLVEEGSILVTLNFSRDAIIDGTKFSSKSGHATTLILKLDPDYNLVNGKQLEANQIVNTFGIRKSESGYLLTGRIIPRSQNSAIEKRMRFCKDNSNKILITKLDFDFNCQWVQSFDRGYSVAYGLETVDSFIYITTQLGQGVFRFDSIYQSDAVNNANSDRTAAIIKLKDCNINTQLIKSTNRLSVQESNANVQWLEYDSGFNPIKGEIGSTLEIPYSGIFAASITQNGCTVISEFVNSSTLGISSPIKSVNSYPNPTTEKIVLELENDQPFTYSIIDSQGKVVLEGMTRTNTIELSKISSGMHTIIIDQDNDIYSSKFIKM